MVSISLAACEMDTVGVSDSLPLVSDVVASADSLVDVSVLLGDDVALVPRSLERLRRRRVDVADDSADSLAVVGGDVVSGVSGRRARRGRGDGSLRGRRHVSLAGLSRRDSRHRRSDRGRGASTGACVSGAVSTSAGAGASDLRCLRHSRCRCRRLGGGLRGRLDGLGSRHFRRRSDHGGGRRCHHRAGLEQGLFPR